MGDRILIAFLLTAEWLSHWGEVGPDAPDDSSIHAAPEGYDEVNRQGKPDLAGAVCWQ